MPRPASPSREARSHHVTRDARQKAMSDARRTLVLDAARSAFVELGLEGASMREIAKRAGYTPGAIYSYFGSKEEMYAALLGESLERLNAHVAAACAAAVGGDQLASAATAFFEFYRDNPRDLDLGFYLFQGLQPRGLTPELDEALNRRLRDALQPTYETLLALGMEPGEALLETTALFAHIVGVLLLSHTGRIRMFKQSSQDLFGRYLRQLTARAALARRPQARGGLRP